MISIVQVSEAEKVAAETNVSIGNEAVGLGLSSCSVPDENGTAELRPPDALTREVAPRDLKRLAAQKTRVVARRSSGMAAARPYRRLWMRPSCVGWRLAFGVRRGGGLIA